MTERMELNKWIAVCLLVVALILPGCLGGAAHLLHILKGHKIPAAFDGLEQKKVAVVCISDASAYGPDTLTHSVAKLVGVKLARNVKKMQLVPVHEIETWIDGHGWNQTDFVELGQGVGAEMVVAIEISSYSIHEGPTMYKGRSDVTVTVYDLSQGGQVAFSMGPQAFQFPESGRPAIQTSDRQFEAVYLAKLTEHIARQFYQFEATEAYADDASMLN